MIDEAALIDELRLAQEDGRHVYLCGNGGSAANALHIANDLVSVGVRAHALTADVSTLTAIANDYGYYHIFSRLLEVFADEGDILIALSGSGRSPNIVGAIETAEVLRMKVFYVTEYLNTMTMQASEEYQVALGHRLMKALKG